MEKIFYCPTEKTERTFTRIDDGLALVGKYQCEGCEDIYNELNLRNEGGDGDLVELIREKLSN